MAPRTHLLTPEVILRSAEVASELDVRVGSPPSDRPEAWIAQMEAHLLGLAHGRALRTISAFVQPGGGALVMGRGTLFQVGREEYDFYVAGDVRSGGLLVVRVENVDPARPRPGRKAGKADISEPGRFRGVRVYADAFFEPIRDDLASGIAVDLDAGYRWCSHQLLASLRTRLRGVGDEIRLHIRKRLPKQLESVVWPYVITRGKGLYLSDEDSRRWALGQASRNPVRVPDSPAALMSEVFTRLLDSNSIFSTEALQERATIIRNLRTPPYQATGFDVAERAVLRFDEIAIKPMVWEGDVLLVVGFPAADIPLLDKPLEHEKKEIAALLRSRSGEIRKVVKELDKSDARFWIDPQLAAWGIRFLGELLENWGAAG